MFDHTDRTGDANRSSIDDATGSTPAFRSRTRCRPRSTAAGLPLATPPRGDNGKAGDAKTPGTTVANVAQQKYFADVAAKVVLPMFKARNKPFVLVFWSRDPDGTQHNQGDSLLQLDARHQRADLARRHQERRRQSGADCARRSTISGWRRRPTS